MRFTIIVAGLILLHGSLATAQFPLRRPARPENAVQPAIHAASAGGCQRRSECSMPSTSAAADLHAIHRECEP